MSSIDELSEKEDLTEHVREQHTGSSNAVEGIQAETHQQQTSDTPQSSLEKYCDENPSASECLIYEE